jgi:hypothetical protein
MYLNGVIFQVHCVNFEINKEQTTHFRLFLYLLFVLILKERTIIFETIWNREKNIFLWKGNIESQCGEHCNFNKSRTASKNYLFHQLMREYKISALVKFK